MFCIYVESMIVWAPFWNLGFAQLIYCIRRIVRIKPCVCWCIEKLEVYKETLQKFPKNEKFHEINKAFEKFKQKFIAVFYSLVLYKTCKRWHSKINWLWNCNNVKLKFIRLKLIENESFKLENYEAQK